MAEPATTNRLSAPGCREQTMKAMMAPGSFGAEKVFKLACARGRSSYRFKLPDCLKPFTLH